MGSPRSLHRAYQPGVLSPHDYIAHPLHGGDRTDAEIARDEHTDRRRAKGIDG
jgi:hypothetical protein